MVTMLVKISHKFVSKQRLRFCLICEARKLSGRIKFEQSFSLELVVRYK